MEFSRGKTEFSLFHKGDKIGDFRLVIPGLHNCLNASAAIIISSLLGVSQSKIASALEEFYGAKRRLELVGVINNVIVYDDYAHHPTEIKATLQAIRSWYPRNPISVIFQPHTYSRTLSLIEEFASSFDIADRVYITEIFSSAREKGQDNMISGAQLAEKIKKRGIKAYFFKTIEEIIANLVSDIHPEEVVTTLGAGDVYGCHLKLLEAIKKSTSEK